MFRQAAIRHVRPMKLAWTAALALAFPALSGCETVPHDPMSYETCATARNCTIRGLMSAQSVGQALMGKLDLPDGRCVSVSLPGDFLARLEASGPVEVTVRGRVYDMPASDVVSMTVEGRTIGLGSCGNFFLFVYDDSELIF